MEFVVTGDGSKTLYHPEIGEHYHSQNGALQESEHVFLKSGLQFLRAKDAVDEVNILEVGFGTGLNFLVTSQYANKEGIKLRYYGIEAYPLMPEIIMQTGYEKFVERELWDSFVANYPVVLEQPVEMLPNITLGIRPCKVMEYTHQGKVDLVYFDAFAAVRQPEMWSEDTLYHVCQFLRPGGVFVTYAITGNLKRAMRNLGFEIEKAPGALGKREMLRAIKL
ncbi:tRNA (5-methylaminomethyl-2-thiouridine)(34)-methyltransferase MnmD [Sphingobacterium sp. JB170]|uniref:tRNA (5-methylaminomethyl-2-thiouridine)(34)-methyltransferase MnmD n=1 Tax=Sphingobacterium sp. JB170 TaxID=1434842 RepID=UPI00097F4C93|nr:tRNA (5-methylaminomethyl-2-thiouridine)(34)-methyltransferase MnmD [Sphingobacterium sp. JB170]SJN25319.1 putative peptidase [Sphingobacterium sp. JB170]